MNKEVLLLKKQSCNAEKVYFTLDPT